ncbi:hypothetical protein ScPMuIL_018032 [Solemya velum]
MAGSEEEIEKTATCRRHYGLPVDRGWAWMVMLGGILATFMMVGNIKSFGIFFVALVEKFDASASMTSSLQGVQFGIYSFSSLFVLTVLLSHVENRVLVCCGGVLSCVAYIITAFAPSVEFMLLSQGVILGVANSLIFGPTIICVGKYFDKRRGLANGLVMSGGSLGSLLLPILLQYLFDEYGLEGTFIIVAGITLNNFVVAALLRPTSFYQNIKTEEECEGESMLMKTQKKVNGTHAISEVETNPFLGSNKKLSDTEKTGSVSDLFFHSSNPNVYKLQSNILCASLASLSVSENVHSSHQNVGVVEISEKLEKENGFLDGIKRVTAIFLKHEILKNPLLYIALQGGLIICPSGALVGIYLPPHARDLNIDETNTALIVSIIGGMDFVGRVSYSILSELRCIERYQLLAFSSILAGVLSNSIRLFTDFRWLCVFAAIYGIIGGAYYVLYTSVLVDFLGVDNLRFSLGMMSITQGLSFSVFLPCLGAVRDVTGSYYTTFHICGCCLTIGGSLFLIFTPLAKRWNGKHNPVSCVDTTL